MEDLEDFSSSAFKTLATVGIRTDTMVNSSTASKVVILSIFSGKYSEDIAFNTPVALSAC